MMRIGSSGMLPLLLLAIFVTAPVAAQTVGIIQTNAAGDNVHIIRWLAPTSAESVEPTPALRLRSAPGSESIGPLGDSASYLTTFAGG